jgi:magnesium transporter
MLKYLTQLLGKPATAPDGARVARVCDVAAAQHERLPVLTALLLADRGRETWVPFADLVIDGDTVRLKAPLDQIFPYTPADDDLHLRRDILDKQIVDVQGYRVVRANDVRIARSGDHYCVVGVDAGLRAIVRRTGIGGPVEAVARAVHWPLHSHLLSWEDVETLEPDSAGGGRIKLKVPHEKIARLHPADIADIVEQLDPQQRAEVIHALDIETAADTIEEMEDEQAAAVMEALEEEKAADILEEMEPDDAADILGDLSDARSEELLDHMDAEEAADVKELLAYGDETAGGLMTTELISVQASMTAEDTIRHMRKLAPQAGTAYYIYVVDEDERLVGVISLRDLIVASPEERIESFMVSNVRHAHTGDDPDDIAQVFTHYNLLALPVVDDDGKLAGIITVDDMMERLVPPERRRRLPQVTVNDELDEE